MAGIMGMPGIGGRPGPTPVTGVGTPYIPGVENIQWGTPLPDLNGDGKPGWTGNLGDAISKEMKMKPPGSDLIIANSSETIIPAAKGFISSQGMYSSSRSGMSSAPITVSAPITIYQQPNQDAEELASMVAMKIGEAVADARAASVFV